MRTVSLVRPALRNCQLGTSSARKLPGLGRSASSAGPTPTAGKAEDAVNNSAEKVDTGSSKPSSSLPVALGVAGVLAAGGAFYAWKSSQIGGEATTGAQPSTAKTAEQKEAEKEAEHARRKAEIEQQKARAEAEEAEKKAELEEQRVQREAEEAQRKALEGAMLAAETLAKEAAISSLALVEHSRAAGIEEREAGKRALKEAIDSKDQARLQEALASAQAANLGSCSETELAQSLLAPSVLLREALHGSNLIAAPAELRGLSPAHAAAAELKASEGMTEEQLKERVVELSRHLAAGRLNAKARLEGVLAMQLEVADDRSLRCLEEALKCLSSEKDLANEKEFEEIDASLHSLHTESVAATRMKACEAAEEVLTSNKALLDADSEDRLALVKSQHLEEVIGSAAGFQHVEEVVGAEAARIESFQARIGLSAAVLGLEGAILEGRICDKELQALQKAASDADSFVSDLFAKLPEECVAICRAGEVPTEETIKKRLPSQLHGIAAAAFLPPGGGVGAEILANLFSHSYFLNCEASEPVFGEDEHGRKVRINLSAISRVLQATESGTPRGELEQALLNLEAALTGSCKDAARKCIAETRAALLLRQALWAAKARVWCLTSTA